jgi:diguanylate cyclase (GGDEF)-like protein
LSGPASREGLLLRWLGAVLTGATLLPVLLTLPWVLALPSLTHRALAALFTAVASAFVVTALVADRTERQLRDSRRRLRMLANIDSLTNVPNRRHFHELATQVLAGDPPGTAAMVIFDVDHFKGINDQLGHAAGDRALRLVARCLQEVLRTNDVPGRHGGDEFVLLLRRASSEHAMAVAQRIVSRVQAQARDFGLPRISMSFGIVHMRRGENVDDALRRADQALYEAKRQGRARAVMAGGDEDTPVFTDSRTLGLRAA